MAFLPINGRDGKRYAGGCIGNMTFQEAVDLAGELGPRLVVPIHHDMVAHNSADPDPFVDDLNATYPGVACAVAAPGERVEVQAPVPTPYNLGKEVSL